MKNENQHFSADRRKFGRHFLDRRGSGRSAFGGGYIYGGECGLPKESFRSEKSEKKKLDQRNISFVWIL